MAEYYSSSLGSSRKRNSRKKGRSLWGAVLDIVMSVISVAVVVAILVIFISRLFEPEKLWYFSLAGLVAPIVYIVAICSALYWIVRWKWRMFILVALFVALGWTHISLYYKINIGKEYGEPRYERGNIKVLSYNIRYFQDETWNHQTTDSIVSLVRKENPDILCMQEFPIKGAEYDKAIDAFKKQKYNHTCVQAQYEDGVIIFSKHRILRSDSINYMCGTAKGLWADIKIKEDTIRIYNLHLQTTAINAEERKYIGDKQFLNTADSGRVNKFADMAQRLYENSCMRSHQVDALRHEMEHCPYPIILCGDFNDVPMSYTYRTVASGLDDTFSKKGNGYAHTFNGFFNLLRIDYILVSKQFETLSYEVLPLDLSDHYPVVARVMLKDEE